MACKHLIREIDGVNAFQRSRNTDIGDDLRMSFVTSLITQINQLTSLSPLDASILEAALKDSAYGADGDNKLRAAIDARVRSTATGKAPKGGCLTQSLKFWWKYATQGDWDHIKDPTKSWNSKMTRIVERGNSVGCTMPDEQSIKWMLAMLLLACYTEQPKPKVIHKKLIDLKECIASERKPWSLEQVVDFPNDPSDLPDAVYNAAYADEPPISIDISGINMIACAIPLRKNNKRLAGEPSTAVDADDWAAIQKPLRGSSKPGIKIEQREGGYKCTNALVSTNADLFDESVHDADESDLLLEYKRKLADLRRLKASRGGDANSPDSHPPTPNEPSAARIANAVPNGGMMLSRDADGNLKIKPRVFGEPAKMELRCPPQPKAEPDSDEESDVVDEPSYKELDPYAKAAVAAMTQRQTKKKEKAKAEAKAKASAGKPKTTPTKAKKKPMPAKAKLQLKKRPGAAAPEDVAKGSIAKAMPKLPADGSNPSPVFYNGGVIYTSVAKKKFRGLTTRGDEYTEKSKGWARCKPIEAWKAVVDEIDAAAKKRK
jgi:hypothetical protein